MISPQLSFIPADLFLLTGDTIVNESMLTGESVPVNKTPASNEDIAKWKDSDDVSRESAKSFMYCGTRVVRVRGSLASDGSTKNPAVGLVVRTGTPPSFPQMELWSCILTLSQDLPQLRELSYGPCYSQSLWVSSSIGTLSDSLECLLGSLDLASQRALCNSFTLASPGIQSWFVPWTSLRSLSRLLSPPHYLLEPALLFIGCASRGSSVSPLAE